MDTDAVESWLLYAIDLYDKKGQMPAIRAFQEVADFASNMQEKLAGRALEDCAGVLERFVCGLNGRPLRIAPGERHFTDTETCFLPPVVGRFPDKDANFRLYKAMVVHQWAQNWYGTWRGGVLLDAIESARLSGADLALFDALEQVRLDACIARDFPGLHRDMGALRRELDETDADWGAISDALAEIGADVVDSLRLTNALSGRRPGACCYRGELDPESVRGRFDIRAALERNRFRVALAKLVEEHDGVAPGEDRPEAETLPETGARLNTRRREDPDSPNGVRFDLFLDGHPVSPPDDLVSTMESII